MPLAKQDCEHTIHLIIYLGEKVLFTDVASNLITSLHVCIYVPGPEQGKTMGEQSIQ